MAESENELQALVNDVNEEDKFYGNISWMAPEIVYDSNENYHFVFQYPHDFIFIIPPTEIDTTINITINIIQPAKAIVSRVNIVVFRS